ncbi:hypothetical protein [Candidatus Symbiopectobacterium sp. NZEC135]|uniref:hypothetical protein n=1 Tax=Candidatus Symbiopectobacterium sp. NZEC135 TaxID=2820471 RepID=UPI0022267782|nr:hypothetical protein [Candidatus Symbiopectobacterium sp. NZEC135]MCW2478829.1 hypothetical protein [Candidatus Symbiopectobacterium sp. NZEC135]
MADFITWLAEPNWTDGVTETLEWKTDVLQSPTGAEQRIARRLSPRRTFEFSILVGDNDRQRLENALFHAGAAHWNMPVFPDVSVLPAALAAGSSSLALDTTGRDFSAGGKLLLKRGIEVGARSSLVAIETVSPEGVTFSTPLAESWPAGTLVYPLRLAMLTDPPDFTRYNATLATAQVRFRVDEHNAFSDDITDLPRYRQHPVLEPDSDWSESVTGQYARLLLELDNGSGLIARTDTARRPFVVQSHAWMPIGNEAHATLRRLFYYLRGRQRAVWIATPSADFYPVSGMNGHAIDVENAGFADLGVVPGRRDVRIRRTDGTCLYRRITAAAVLSSTTERLLLDGDAISLALDDIESISFMALCRQESDSVEWQHVTDTDGLTTVSTTFRGIRDELESV